MNETAVGPFFRLPQAVSLRDVDELNHAISGSNLELLQLNTGLFQGTLGHMSLGELSIDQGSLVSPVRARGALDLERFGLSIFHGRSRGNWNGHPLDASRVLYFRPGGELDGHTAAGAYGWTSLIFPTDWIESIAQTVRHPKGLMRSESRTFRPNALLLADLWQAVSEIMDSGVDGTENTGQAKWLIANLRNALGAMLTADDGQQPKTLTSGLCRFSVARRAERYMRERIEEPFCVDDVSVAVRVSRRYLEYVFADAFGTSPSRYLRLSRLHEVRRRLKKPGTTTTVTREAVALGFNHLGLFSVQYKKTFGESPSETLAKAAHR